MVTEFRVTTDTISPFVKKFGKKAPIVIGEGLHKIARNAQKNLRASITRNRLKWTGHLWTATEARKMSKKRSVVFIPGYGEQLDSMKTHWVSLKRGRNITRWAREAPNSPWKGSKPRGLPRAIEVHAHPWIDRPLELTEKASIKIMNEQLNKVMA